jgi:Amt family ammonium transporter
LWALLGYSLAFTGSGALIGGLDNVFLRGVGLEAKGTIPHVLFMAFQGTFAIVTAVLIAGAVVERMRFSAYLAFIGLWSLVVYAPVAHWVWGGGWLSKLGVLDYAGGTVVHINAGVAAAVAAVLVGGRKDFGRQAMLPHNVPFVLLGSSLLYFGWFGFNSGSALAANGAAALAFANTFLAPMSALAAWMALDVLRTGRATAVGAATAIVVGLVVITPAAGFVSPLAALAMGALGAVPSYFTIVWRARTRLDDSLDVVGGHGVGGISGALLTGVFCSAAWGGTDGFLHGNPKQLGLQAIGVLATIVYSAVASFALLKLISLVVPLRAASRDEGRGMDITSHGEEAYAEREGAVLVFHEAAPPLSIKAASAEGLSAVSSPVGV